MIKLAKNDDSIKVIVEMLGVLSKNGLNVQIKSVYDITTKDGKPFVSIYPEDKYIKFHEEFTQIGYLKPGGKEIVELAIEHGWEHNHD